MKNTRGSMVELGDVVRVIEMCKWFIHVLPDHACPEARAFILRSMLVTLCGVSLLFPDHALAMSCAEDLSGTHRFVHPDKVWLPANAKGVLFIAPGYLELKTKLFLVLSEKGFLLATVEPVVVADTHVLKAVMSNETRLWRVGVVGGFVPSSAYEIIYRGRTGHDFIQSVKFTVGTASFDIRKVAPRVTLVRGPERVSRLTLFNEYDDISAQHSGVVLKFRIAPEGSNPQSASGLTVIAEKSLDGAKFKPMGDGLGPCAWQPVGRMWEEAPHRMVVLQDGCVTPKRIQVRAWLGMLEVDDHFAASAPITVAWDKPLFGTCSWSRKLLDWADP